MSDLSKTLKNTAMFAGVMMFIMLLFPIIAKTSETKPLKGSFWKGSGYGITGLAIVSIILIIVMIIMMVVANGDSNAMLGLAGDGVGILLVIISFIANGKMHSFKKFLQIFSWGKVHFTFAHCFYHIMIFVLMFAVLLDLAANLSKKNN